jgi:fructosamine-3-kinase
MHVWDSVASAISIATQRPFTLHSTSAFSGGSINETLSIVGTDGARYFIKLHTSQHQAMFEAEVAGLTAIGATGTLRVPRHITHGTVGDQSYLVLEHLPLNAQGDAALLGAQLAALHRCSAPQFGFAQDNFIGTTPQPNTWNDDWVTFWREQRLGYQLRLAAENGHGGTLQSLGERLLDVLPVFFANHKPLPSLLHGDLWSGNHAFLADGTPAVFDPATYFGDRECDLAMTELFGGFSPDFYAAYRAAWPLDEGYADRRELYNLYHILNHANLFGGGYARQARQMMQNLLTWFV